MHVPAARTAGVGAQQECFATNHQVHVACPYHTIPTIHTMPTSSHLKYNFFKSRFRNAVPHRGHSIRPAWISDDQQLKQHACEQLVDEKGATGGRPHFAHVFCASSSSSKADICMVARSAWVGSSLGFLSPRNPGVTWLVLWPTFVPWNETPKQPSNELGNILFRALHM